MMTKQMMPWEFKQYIAQNRPSKVRFDSDSQKWFDPFGVSPTYSLLFPNIDVGINPTRIIISDSTGGNCVCFEGVECIRVEKAVPEALRVKYNIYCSTPLRGSDPSSREYTVWAELKN